MQYNRILILLDALGNGKPRHLPKGVGLKTLIEARDHGLIELVGDFRHAQCLSTAKGRELRQKFRGRHNDHTSLHFSASSPTENVGGGG